MWGAKWDVPTLIKNLETVGFEGVELRTEHEHKVEPNLSRAAQGVAQRFADSRVRLVDWEAIASTTRRSVRAQKANRKHKEFIASVTDVRGSGVKVKPTSCRPRCPPIRRSSRSDARSTKWPPTAKDTASRSGSRSMGRARARVPNIKKIMDVATHPNAKLCWNCNPEDMKGPGLEANL